MEVSLLRSGIQGDMILWVVVFHSPGFILLRGACCGSENIIFTRRWKHLFGEDMGAAWWDTEFIVDEIPTRSRAGDLDSHGPFLGSHIPDTKLGLFREHRCTAGKATAGDCGTEFEKSPA